MSRARRRRPEEARLAEGAAARVVAPEGAPDVTRYAGSKQGVGRKKAEAIVAGGKTVLLKEISGALKDGWLERRAMGIACNIILELIGEYEHPKPEIRDFVRGAIRYMARSWRSAQLALLEGMWNGFSVAEIVWETDPPAPYEGKWLVKQLRPLPPESFWPEGLDIAAGLEQEVLIQNKGGPEEIVIPGYQCVHWAFESADNPYGRPLGRNLWMLVEGRREKFKNWLTGLEMLGQPYIVEKTGKGWVVDNRTKEKKSRVDAALEDWSDAQGGSVIVREAANDDGSLPSIEALKVAGWTEEFRQFFGYTDRSLMLGVGVLAMLVMEPEHATRAQATVQQPVQQLMLSPVAAEFAQGVLIDQLAEQLVCYNFGPQETYGEFPVARQMDEETLGQILESLGRIGAFGSLPRPYYRKISEQFPELLPTEEELDEAGLGDGGGLPPGVTA